ncbi:MAG: hypothetical protein KJ674_02495 [Nanoarchaeota archaeon]|nr:hypothetical protein [Nanoarchaeota archaeon]
MLDLKKKIDRGYVELAKKYPESLLPRDCRANDNECGMLGIKSAVGYMVEAGLNKSEIKEAFVKIYHDTLGRSLYERYFVKPKLC